MITKFETYNEGLFSTSLIDKKFNKLVDEIKETFDINDLKQVPYNKYLKDDYRYVYNNIDVYFYENSRSWHWEVLIDGKKYSDVSRKPAKKLYYWFDKQYKNNIGKNVDFKLKKEQPIFNSKTGERLVKIPVESDITKPTLGLGQKIKKFLD